MSGEFVKQTAFDWSAILQKHGIEVPYGRKEFNVACPLHEDRSPSLSINISKGVWICHAGCGAGGLKDFLRAYLGKSSSDLSFDAEFQEVKFDWGESAEEEEEPLFPVDYPFKSGKPPAFFYERGFTEETVEKWQCGITDEGSLVVPIRSDIGDIVGWVCRRTEDKKPKYVYSKGFKRAKVVFGLYNITRLKPPYVCIVEGPLDAMWLYQHRIPAVALLGVFCSKAQERLISKLPVGEIVMCLDNDEAGKESTKPLSRRLSKYFPVSTVNFPDGVKDVQEIRDVAKLKELIDRRTVCLV
jgi:DNA primase